MSEALITQIIAGVVTLGVAFFGYLKLKAGQKNVEGKVDSYHKEVNGMKEQLIGAVAGQNKAEGQLLEIDKAKQDVKDTAKIVADTPTPAVQEVKIVEQAKPIDVKIEKDKK